MDIDLLSAFIIGLLSAGHCLAMCGGITSMLTSAISQDPLLKNNLLQNNVPKEKTQSKLVIILCYNIGRIGSYAILGAIVGFTGSIAAKSIGLPLAGLRIIAGIFLVLLGLYLGQWLMILSRVESIGKKLWQYISPLSKKVIPVNSPLKALSLGAIWGWLPCGLVYSTLTWSLASGDPQTGALIMASFGLGTLPALLTMSFGLLSIKNFLKNNTVRKSIAIIIIFYGFYSIYFSYQLIF